MAGLSTLTAAAALLAGLAGGAWAEDARAFQTHSRLVEVPVAINEADGRFLSGLSRSDFLLYEDDHSVPVVSADAERGPAAVGLVLDLSGSVKGLEQLQRLAVDRILRTHEDQDEFSVTVVRGHAEVWPEWLHRDDHRIRAITDAPRGGDTALLDGVAATVRRLNQSQLPLRELIVISDCEDNRSRAGISQLRALLRESGIQLHVLALPPDSLLDPTFVRTGLHHLSAETGGSFVAVNNSAAVERWAQHLDPHLRYRLTFIPLSEPDGELHQVQLKLASEGGGRLARQIQWRRSFRSE